MYKDPIAYPLIVYDEGMNEAINPMPVDSKIEPPDTNPVSRGVQMNNPYDKSPKEPVWKRILRIVVIALIIAGIILVVRDGFGM